MPHWTCECGAQACILMPLIMSSWQLEQWNLLGTQLSTRLYPIGYLLMFIEAQLPPRDPREAVYVSVEILAYCCTNNANRSRVSMKSTFRHKYSTASIQCRACHQQLPYNQSCWCQLDCNCDQPTLTMTNVVHDDTAPSWTRTSVADGHKFSALRCLSRRLLDRSYSATFSYPTWIWRPSGGDPLEFRRDLLHRKTRGPELSCRVVRMILHLVVLIYNFDLWQTIRRTRDDSKYRASIASHG